MKRDILFLVSGIPKEFLFHGAHYFMATAAEHILAEFQKVADRIPRFRAFLRTADAKNTTCVGFRNEFETLAGDAHCTDAEA